MKTRRPLFRIVGLRDVMATVFALVAILPLLVFLSLLNRFDLLRETQAQAGLFLALLISVLGFLLFRKVGDRVSQVAQALQAAERSHLGTRPGEVMAPTVPELGMVGELVQIREAFNHMLGDLRGSTERLEDVVFKLVTLNEMVELAARIPTMEDLLALVLERTMRTVRADVGSIMLLDHENQTLRIAAARGVPGEILLGVEIKLGEEVAGQVAQLGHTVLIDDVDKDPRFANDPKYGSGSLLCMPVRAGDRIIGVINLAKKEHGATGHPDSGAFGPIDVQFLNPLMTYVAYAVDNARLLQETRLSAKRLQEVIDELKGAQEQLVQGETLQAVGVLASGITHHLNNLLAVVQGRIRLVLDEAKEPAVRRSLEIAEAAALEGADVVRRVREFGQSRCMGEKGPVDLNQLAEEALEITRPHWQDDAQLHGTQIQVSVEPGQIPAVTGDAASLREVLMGLILNAVDALPTGGQITARTWASEQWVCCSVADTGAGMPEEVRRHALEPFFTTKGPHSTGLGLSVTHGIVQRHGGELDIESAEGRGTTVQIRLPMPRPASGPRAADAGVSPAGTACR